MLIGKTEEIKKEEAFTKYLIKQSSNADGQNINVAYPNRIQKLGLNIYKQKFSLKEKITLDEEMGSYFSVTNHFFMKAWDNAIGIGNLKAWEFAPFSTKKCPYSKENYTTKQKYIVLEGLIKLGMVENKGIFEKKRIFKFKPLKLYNQEK